MPGMSLWLSYDLEAREMLPRFKRAQEAMLHGPGYRDEVVVARGRCLLGTTRFGAYPIRTIEVDGQSILVEGHVYNKRADELEAELTYASASTTLPADVEHAAARVRLVVSSLAEAAPVDVPRRVQEALEELEEAAAGLESERELDAPRKLLVAGIRQLEGELVGLAESAWRGDHRSALNRLDGTRTIENALSQLAR